MSPAVPSLRPGARLAILLLWAAASAASGQSAQERVDRLELRWWAEDATGGVFDLTRTPDGLLWAATGDGLLRLDGIETTRFLPGVDPASNNRADKPRQIRAVEPDATGALIVATDDGAYRFDGRRFVLLSRPGVGGRPWAAKLLHLDRDRVLWLAAADSLLRLDPNAFSLRQGLPGVPVSLLWEDPFGYLWATTESGQVFRRLGNAFHPVNFPLGLGEVKVQCLHLDTEGFLWLVRSDRAWRIEGDFAGAGLPRTASPLESLGELPIRTCASEPDGGVWLGTAHGLIYAADDGSRAAVPGLEAGVRTILITDRGDVWAGTDRGIAQLHDPSAEPPLPEVLVLAAWIDGAEIALNETLDLSADVEMLRLRLSAPSFHRPAEVKVRYRWNQEAWQELADGDLLLPDPKAGRRTLTLQAGRGDRWNEPGTELVVERRPDLWQTRTFWAAVGAALTAVVVWVLYLLWADTGASPMEYREDYDDDVVHLEDLDTDELKVSEESIRRSRLKVFRDDHPRNDLPEDRS